MSDTTERVADLLEKFNDRLEELDADICYRELVSQIYKLGKELDAALNLDESANGEALPLALAVEVLRTANPNYQTFNVVIPVFQEFCISPNPLPPKRVEDCVVTFHQTSTPTGKWWRYGELLICPVREF